VIGDLSRGCQIENQDEEGARLQVFNPRSSASVQACKISGGVYLHTVWLTLLVLQAQDSRSRMRKPPDLDSQLCWHLWEERELGKGLWIVTWLDLVHFIPCYRDLNNFGIVDDVYTSVVYQ
jgi:hypothetical protein